MHSTASCEVIHIYLAAGSLLHDRLQLAMRLRRGQRRLLFLVLCLRAL